MGTVNYNFIPLLEDYVRYKIRLKYCNYSKSIEKKSNQKAHFRHFFSVEIAPFKNFDSIFFQMHLLDSLVSVGLCFVSFFNFFNYFVPIFDFIQTKEKKQQRISNRTVPVGTITISLLRYCTQYIKIAVAMIKNVLSSSGLPPLEPLLTNILSLDTPMCTMPQIPFIKQHGVSRTTITTCTRAIRCIHVMSCYKMKIKD